MKPSPATTSAHMTESTPQRAQRLSRSISTSLIALFLATSAALASDNALAAGESPNGTRSAAAKLDTDGDKRISRAEAAARPGLAKHFDDIDANRDGYLTREEMQAYRQKQMAARLKAIDTNGDGKISRAEADAKAPRLASHFDKLDTNKDGFLSREELAAHAAHHGGRK
jgi:hypothetical protein